MIDKKALEDAINRISVMTSEYYKRTRVMVFGFSYEVPEDAVWLVDESCTQDGKRIFLMKPGGLAHTKLVEAERKYEISIERVNGETAFKLLKLGFILTSETKINNTK